MEPRRTKKKILKPAKEIQVTGPVTFNTDESEPLSIIYKNIEELKQKLQASYLKYKAAREKHPEKDSIIASISGLTQKQPTSTCLLLDIPILKSEVLKVVVNFKNSKIELGHVHALFQGILPTYMAEDGSVYAITPSCIEDNAEILTEAVLAGCYTLKTNIKNCKYRGYNRFNNSKFPETFSNKAEGYKFGVFSPTFSITHGLKYTFGIEIECEQSYMPNYVSKNFNVSCVRDGSIDSSKIQGLGENGGPEYVTGVLQGDTGMLHLQKLLNYIKPRSSINPSCGIHVHIGGMSDTKQFAVAMRRLGYLVQDSLLAILPVSRRNNEYCRPLINLETCNIPNIDSPNFKANLDKAYDGLVNYVGSVDLLSEGRNKLSGRMLNKKQPHPLGRKCNYNHKAARYEWLNLVPLLFDDKGKAVYTVEFRPHSASLDFVKIKNWVLICMALVNYAETNYERISSKKPISIEEVIKTIYKEKGNSLLEYIKRRKELFKSDPNQEKIEYAKESFSEPEQNQTLKTLCVQ